MSIRLPFLHTGSMEILGGVVVSVAAFSPRGREFDAHGLLRFHLPSEA